MNPEIVLNLGKILLHQKHYRYNYNTDIFKATSEFTGSPGTKFCKFCLKLSNTMYVIC